MLNFNDILISENNLKTNFLLLNHLLLLYKYKQNIGEIENFKLG